MCDISIIIPFYNKTEMTKDCLRSIAATTPNPIADGRYTYEIVLVDDRSSEPYSFESEEKSCLALRVVRNETNLGFAGSCNRGASMANGRYLVFLNNDTLVCEGWLEEMVKAIQADPSVGMVGNKLLYPDERVQHAGFVFDEAGMPFLLYRRFPPSFSGVNKTREFQAVIGACF